MTRSLPHSVSNQCLKHVTEPVRINHRQEIISRTSLNTVYFCTFDGSSVLNSVLDGVLSPKLVHFLHHPDKRGRRDSIIFSQPEAPLAARPMSLKMVDLRSYLASPTRGRHAPRSAQPPGNAATPLALLDHQEMQPSSCDESSTCADTCTGTGIEK